MPFSVHICFWYRGPLQTSDPCCLQSDEEAFPKHSAFSDHLWLHQTLHTDLVLDTTGQGALPPLNISTENIMPLLCSHHSVKHSALNEGRRENTTLWLFHIREFLKLNSGSTLRYFLWYLQKVFYPIQKVSQSLSQSRSPRMGVFGDMLTHSVLFSCPCTVFDILKL